jgi:hypothetical protein
MKSCGNERPQKKILHGKLKGFLPKKLYVILQSHKSGTVKAVILRKGSQENAENRLKIKEEKNQKGGEQK